MGRTKLIVRRVKALNPAAANGQDERFDAWRYHAVFTDNPHQLIQAEGEHRDHAIVVRMFAANAAWLSLAALTHNLLRSAGTLTSAFHGKARAATLRRHLVWCRLDWPGMPRGYITLHLPCH